ncbi:nucleotidyltransferase domain-containing protein [Streptomyces sp. NPDC006704]|uniref:nucleotidyltransferase domain-containing protein n=1 Tax=Streptomyces sp. NPDC006704 TaxID=3364760 RepID=UPI00368A1AA5
MKRERATSLLQEMLTRLDAGERPLDLVDAVHVFGSYARGALEPADVDVAVTHHVDADFSAELVSDMMYGRDPMAPMKRALKGNKRGIQFQFNQNDALTEMGTELSLLWQRGDTLAQAQERLATFIADPKAGRAERDHMIEQFDGLDKWIPRPVRADLVALAGAGAIDIRRLELADAQPVDPDAVEVLDRWTETSPLRRAAAAALHHAEFTGHAPHTLWVQGQTVGAPWTADFRGTLWISFGWRYFNELAYRLRDGLEWLEVIRPTRTQPLYALHLTVRARDRLPDH